MGRTTSVPRTFAPYVLAPHSSVLNLWQQPPVDVHAAPIWNWLWAMLATHVCSKDQEVCVSTCTFGSVFLVDQLRREKNLTRNLTSGFQYIGESWDLRDVEIYCMQGVSLNSSLPVHHLLDHSKS